MKTLYFYDSVKVQNIKGQEEDRRLTIAGVIDDENNTIKIGIAQCSPKDQFIKAKGRAIATGRAKSSNPYMTISDVDSHLSTKTFVNKAKEIAKQY